MTRRPTVGVLIGLLIVTTGVLLELQPLKDNSFFTHLATGRLILDRGSVPTIDPYTFTAAGEPWVVQSWLVSVLYATTEAIAGINGVRLLAGALAGAVAGIGWRLLRPADGVVVRLGAAAIFVAIGAGVWAERPLMVGLVAFGLTVLAAEGGLDPRWLIPLGWIWVNSHGSFPLGLVYLVLVAVGARLDASDWDREVRCLGFAAIGTLVGVVGPLGLRALTFPVELLQRQELLSNVVEWQAPGFSSISERAFLVQIVIAIVLLVRRPVYRTALPMAAFIAAALLGSRNIAVASIVMLPGIASGLAGVGALSCAARPRRGGALLLASLALAGLFVSARLQGDALQLAAYPVDVLGYIEHHDIDTRTTRMATPEFVGNLMTYVYGPQGRVFYDDRFDMFPAEVSEASLALSDAKPSAFATLDAFEIELVTVRRDSPLALALARDAGWRVLHVDEHWSLSCRRGADLRGSAGRC